MQPEIETLTITTSLHSTIQGAFDRDRAYRLYPQAAGNVIQGKRLALPQDVQVSQQKTYEKYPAAALQLGVGPGRETASRCQQDAAHEIGGEGY
jgi:hypothetical protein